MKFKKYNTTLHRNAEAGHKSCEKLQLLRPKRLGSLTEKRSASGELGVISQE
jgi:hypothetical protein